MIATILSVGGGWRGRGRNMNRILYTIYLVLYKNWCPKKMRLMIFLPVLILICISEWEENYFYIHACYVHTFFNICCMILYSFWIYKSLVFYQQRSKCKTSKLYLIYSLWKFKKGILKFKYISFELLLLDNLHVHPIRCNSSMKYSIYAWYQNTIF